jgi:hypothetical protein
MATPASVLRDIKAQSNTVKILCAQSIIAHEDGDIRESNKLLDLAGSVARAAHNLIQKHPSAQARSYSAKMLDYLGDALTVK